MYFSVLAWNHMLGLLLNHHKMGHRSSLIQRKWIVARLKIWSTAVVHINVYFFFSFDLDSQTWSVVEPSSNSQVHLLNCLFVMLKLIKHLGNTLITVKCTFYSVVKKYLNHYMSPFLIKRHNFAPSFCKSVCLSQLVSATFHKLQYQISWYFGGSYICILPGIYDPLNFVGVLN